MKKEYPALSHGHARKGKWSPEYVAWRSMKARCKYPSVENYPRYGGLGVKVHLAWMDDFTAFFEHVGPRPSPKHSLDRHPNPKGDYEPGNVRWATSKEQARNRKTTVLHEIDGVTMTLPEWAEMFWTGKINVPQLIFNRMRAGWPNWEAILSPVGHRLGEEPQRLLVDLDAAPKKP